MNYVNGDRNILKKKYIGHLKEIYNLIITFLLDK